MTVETADKKPKRIYQHWYDLGVDPPRCPEHGCLCKVGSTPIKSDGRKLQYRYCPVENCGYSMKITIPAPQPQAE